MGVIKFSIFTAVLAAGAAYYLGFLPTHRLDMVGLALTIGVFAASVSVLIFALRMALRLITFLVLLTAIALAWIFYLGPWLSSFPAR